MAQGASRVPFWGTKNQGHLDKARFSERTHWETYNRPHLVIWYGRFHKTTPRLQEHWYFNATWFNNFRRVFNNFWSFGSTPPLPFWISALYCTYLAISWRGCGGGHPPLSHFSQCKALEKRGALCIYNAPHWLMYLQCSVLTYVFTMLRIDSNGRSSLKLDQILLRGLCTLQLE